MHDSSIFKIRIDFDKSRDSYIYDKNTCRRYLDFFGLYASLPLGYSHPVFKSKDFRREYNRVAAVKLPNCEIISDEAQGFLKEFSGRLEMKGFKRFHFCCTGALAIEAAIKIAIDQKGSLRPVILSLRESFHGINSYGGFVTDRFSPVSTRLDGLPEMGWPKLTTPKIIYGSNFKIDKKATAAGMNKFLNEFNACLRKYGKNNIAALLVEPIQATFGDNYYPREFFTTISGLCDKYDIALIFDEVQTGMGVTGTMWYFQQTGIIPDIVAFGKKLQVSGVMAKRKFVETFKRPVRLEVTWDGNLSDMVRAKYILRAYKKYRILENVRRRGKELAKGLRSVEPLKNVRTCGLLAAFDFVNAEACDKFFKAVVKEGLLCNKTRGIAVRLRPNLNVSSEEIKEALRIIKKCAYKI